MMTENQTLNYSFSNLIRDKVVTLVGPAAYLSGAGRGIEIDDCDIVVRVNRGIEITERDSIDVGRRTDVLYSCLLETSRNAGEIQISLLKRAKVQMICIPGFKRTNFFGQLSYGSHGEINDDTWAKLRSSNLYPPRIVPEKIAMDLEVATQTRPNTGFLAIYDILEARPRTLRITGFSFYLDGFFPGTKLGVDNEGFEDENSFALQALNSRRHRQSSLWRHAKKTLLCHSHVQLDGVLETILSLKSFPPNTIEKNHIFHQRSSLWSQTGAS